MMKVKRWHVIGGLVVFVILAVVIVIPGSRAKYQVSGSIDIVDGEVSYSFADLNVLAVYLEDDNGDYVSSDTVPSSGYTLSSDTYCEVDGIIDSSVTVTYESGAIYVGNITQKGTKCYLYFDVYTGITVSDIIASHNLDTRDSFSTMLTADTTGTLYYVEDGMYGGYSYYYAGAVTDNYVKFAGYYWRIVRFNGDGSIRLIYQGSSTTDTGQLSSTSQFNSIYTSAYYVGYTYEEGYQRPTTQNGGADSTIKGVLDTWYSTYLSGYSNYLDTSGKFCNDRTSYTDIAGTTEGWASSGATYYYGAYIRLETNKSPSFGCSATNDVYTQPVGLITADEVIFAGGGGNNSSYYLYTGNYYWTMTPSHYYSGSVARVYFVMSNGNLSYSNATSTYYGVRPVINLSSNVLLKGSGTASEPYEVV